MRDMLQLRRERVHALRVDGLDRGGVEPGWCRERDADVCVGANSHRWLARAVCPTTTRGDGRAEKRPFVHRFGKSLQEDGEIGEASVVTGRWSFWGRGRGVEGGGGDDLGVVRGPSGWGKVVFGYVRVERGHHVVQVCNVEARGAAGNVKSANMRATH